MSVFERSSDQSIEVLVVGADLMTAHLITADLCRQAQFQITECAPDLDSISSCLTNSLPSALMIIGTAAGEAFLEHLALLRHVRNRFPGARPIVILNDLSREVVAELFRAGAKGVFCRPEYDSQVLCRCIRCVSSGQIWANSEQLGFVLDAFAEHPPVPLKNAEGSQLLTRREEDVVRHVREGMTNRQIAKELYLSEHTIRNNLFRIFNKLGVSTRVELALYGSHSTKRGPSREPDPRSVEREVMLSRTA